MMQFIFVFTAIGVSHWCAHLLECERCAKAMSFLLGFVFEFLVCVLGWPKAAMEYLLDFIAAPRTGLTVDEVDAHVEKLVKKQKMEITAGFERFLNQEIGEIRIEKIEGESAKDFVDRACKEVERRIKETNQKKKEVSRESKSPSST